MSFILHMPCILTIVGHLMNKSHGPFISLSWKLFRQSEVRHISCSPILGMQWNTFCGDWCYIYDYRLFSCIRVTFINCNTQCKLMVSDCPTGGDDLDGCGNFWRDYSRCITPWLYPDTTAHWQPCVGRIGPDFCISVYIDFHGATTAISYCFQMLDISNHLKFHILWDKRRNLCLYRNRLQGPYAFHVLMAHKFKFNHIYFTSQMNKCSNCWEMYNFHTGMGSCYVIHLRM